MILVGNYDSPFVRRVAVALHHYDLPFERRVISVFKGFEEMLKTNPLGKVPALEIEGGEILIDSSIILDYLEGIAGDEKRLVPIEEPLRRTILHTEAVALGLAEKAVELRIELYRKNPAARDTEWVLRLERQVESALAWLDNSRPSPWFHDVGMSLPDITTVVAYTYLRNKLPERIWLEKYEYLEKQHRYCETISEFVAAAYSESEAQASY
jgi:glutathione S-transferase